MERKYDSLTRLLKDRIPNRASASVRDRDRLGSGSHPVTVRKSDGSEKVISGDFDPGPMLIRPARRKGMHGGPKPTGGQVDPSSVQGTPWKERVVKNDPVRFQRNLMQGDLRKLLIAWNRLVSQYHDLELAISKAPQRSKVKLERQRTAVGSEMKLLKTRTTEIQNFLGVRPAPMLVRIEDALGSRLAPIAAHEFPGFIASRVNLAQSAVSGTGLVRED